jgi:hypothetical protein
MQKLAGFTILSCVFFFSPLEASSDPMDDINPSKESRPVPAATGGREGEGVAPLRFSIKQKAGNNARATAVDLTGRHVEVDQDAEKGDAEFHVGPDAAATTLRLAAIGKKK